MSASRPIEAWERQPGEPDDPWKAFATYRDQTIPRLLENAAIKGRAQLATWMKDWSWRDRAAAYDRHLDGIRRVEREAILRQSEKDRAARQLSLVHNAMSIVEKEIVKLSKDCDATEMFGTVKVGELNKLMVNVITLERLIRGQSTENVTTTNVELSKLSVDDLRALKEIRARMLGESEEGDARH